MNAHLPAEILDALNQHPEQPVRIRDDATQKVYVVIAEESLPTLWDDYLRREIDKGLAAAKRGDVAEWDVEATIAEAQRRAAARKG